MAFSVFISYPEEFRSIKILSNVIAVITIGIILSLGGILIYNYYHSEKVDINLEDRYGEISNLEFLCLGSIKCVIKSHYSSDECQEYNFPDIIFYNNQTYNVSLCKSSNINDTIELMFGLPRFIDINTDKLAGIQLGEFVYYFLYPNNWGWRPFIVDKFISIDEINDQKEDRYDGHLDFYEKDMGTITDSCLGFYGEYNPSPKICNWVNFKYSQSITIKRTSRGQNTFDLGARIFGLTGIWTLAEKLVKPWKIWHRKKYGVIDKNQEKGKELTNVDLG